MSESSSTYYGPLSDTTPRTVPRTATSGALSPEVLNDLHKMCKSMRHMEKLLKVLCLLQLENQRMYRVETDYGNLFDLGANRQKQQHRKSTVSLLDILD